jgi:flagellar biosynthesis protein FlhG
MHWTGNRHAREAWVPPDADLDQASGLRRLLGGETGARAVGVFGVDPDLTAQTTANLASAMARRGARVLICDELPTPRNVAAYLGLAPDMGLREALASGRPGDARVEASPGVHLLRCTQAAGEIAAPDAWASLGRALDSDWIFAAAPGDGRAPLALAAPERILVAPASKRHLTEAYALLKSVHHLQPEGHWWVLLTGLTDAARGTLVMQAITETSRRFLEFEPGYLGGVPRDAKLDLATRAMRPVLDYAPASPAAGALRGACEVLARTAVTAGSRPFWPRAALIARALAARPTTQARGSTHDRRYG